MSFGVTRCPLLVLLAHITLTLTFTVAQDSAPALELPPELKQRLVVGYQGWFSAQGDGTGLGFRHWGGPDGFQPGHCTVDLWPDLSEFSSEEKYATKFLHNDGAIAHVFSSAHPKTVLRHFRWMREYGIGGAMLQRFVVSLRHTKLRAFRDRVLENVRAASVATQVPWALMYDLSGSRSSEVREAVLQDLDHWGATIRSDKNYLHLNAKPIVGIWGVGFSDDRDYSLADCQSLVDALRARGWAIFMGVPFWWERGDRDAIADPELQALIGAVDIVSPWSVGRYRTPKEAAHVIPKRAEAFRSALTNSSAEHCPVVFPGFSWHNLQKTRGKEAPLNSIPRRGGEFLQAQLAACLQSKASLIYVAMFDEVDEGTAVFKVTPNPPTGESPFLPLDDRPTDHYLRLVGHAAKQLGAESKPR